MEDVGAGLDDSGGKLAVEENAQDSSLKIIGDVSPAIIAVIACIIKDWRSNFVGYTQSLLSPSATSINNPSLYIIGSKLYLANDSFSGGEEVPGISVVDGHEGGKKLKYTSPTPVTQFNHSSEALVLGVEGVNLKPSIPHDPPGSSIQPQPVQTVEKRPSLFLFRNKEVYLALNFTISEKSKFVLFTEQELIEALESSATTSITFTPLINIKFCASCPEYQIALFFNGSRYRYYLHVDGKRIFKVMTPLKAIHEDDWMHHLQFSHEMFTATCDECKMGSAGEEEAK